MAIPQYNFTVNLDDLAFILTQIKIAEASTTPDGQIANLAALVGSPLLPYGLRTVDGTWNNLLPGQERFGAADNVMPRLVAGTFHAAEGSPVNFFGPGGPVFPTTSYAQTAPGNVVFDSQPRIISNLIADQTDNNPAAVIAALDRAANSTFPGADVVQVTPNGTLVIPNQSPDIGLSAPFNGVMTLFGQFFDHGLDLITKGGGTVFVPLMPDDPLYVVGSPTNFMVLSRAVNTTGPGADGILGTADDDLNAHTNTTTPFVDQNQTYTSHPSHQVFLREYIMVGGKPLATGHLLNGAHGEGNWGEVKAQAHNLLGINLTDADVFNVPLLATDRYGAFIRGPNGFVQLVTATGLVEGDPLANGGLGIDVPANIVRTDHQFLIDVAHGAAPGTFDHDHNPATPKIALVADADDVLGGLPNTAANGSLDPYDPSLPISATNVLLLPQPVGTYDNEMLDRHFATGDGRGNENIGLTTMHAIFHSEHNRLVEGYKQTILGSGDLALLNEWLTVDVMAIPTLPAAISALVWDGERLFQAGRFGTEMQYQHLVFEEFARAVQPAVNPFVFTNSADINPAIVEEFANVVYRFGHSMLTETVARLDPNLVADDVGLIQAFLNPPEFDKGGVSEATAIGGIIRGMSRQVGNEIDEFITEALRNNLVGLPLDLAVLNIARARETGAPSFNEARAAFFATSGDPQLTPYTSWADFAPHLKNPASIINFIAAYGLHDSITSETTVAGKRAAATVMVMGQFDVNGNGVIGAGETAAADRFDFLHSTGAWTAANSGLNKVDFWIGGLAEAKLEFGGMLGPTFNFVFENQLEKLQNGDRFYYLSRTQGLNMINELEANSFSALAMRNSNLGDAGTTTHLPGKLFSTPSYTLEMDQTHQRTGILGPDGHTLNGDPTRASAILNAFNPLVVRVAPGADVNGDGFADGGVLSYAYDGGDHVVLGGTQGNDTLRGGRGMDTIWGDAGNDRIDGGDEADEIHGGDGDDIITDHGTPTGAADFLRGDEGNDVISNGPGADIVFGGGGSDFFIVGNDVTEVFAGRGDDFILGGVAPDVLMGNEGDDWIEGGEGLDGISGENSQLFFNSTIIGHDVLNGQGNDTDYDGESGDDIMVQGPGIQRSNGMFGFDWGIHKGDPVGANSDLGIPIFLTQQPFTLRDRFDSVEGLSGWKFNDILTGAALLKGGAAGFGVGPGNPPDESDLKSQHVSLINGLAELLGLTPAQVAAMPFNTSVIDITTGAEVIIGGGGSDTIKGNLGNDFLDGDAWLNVRIRVTHKDNPLTAVDENANTAANEWFTVDSMSELSARMLSGEINPGQLHIVREILQSATALTDVDTAVYNGLFAEYTVTPNINGSITVIHNTLGPVSDGTDTIRNFEKLQFADRVVTLSSVIITGSATEDQTLTADTAGIFGTVLSFQWFRNGVVIGGAINNTLVLGDADVGMGITVLVNFTDLADNVTLAVSRPSAPVININDVPVGLPVITGIATEDQVLTVSAAGITDADGLGLFSYQWTRNGVSIAGATGPTLTLGDADVGAMIAAVVSYTDLNGTLEVLTSAATLPVVNVNDAPTIAATAAVTVLEDGVATGIALGSDVDIGTVLSYSTGAAANGIATIAAATGAWSYAPALNFNGTDSFIVTVSDGLLSANQSITVTVTAVNDAPVGTATAVLAAGTEDTAYVVSAASLLAGFSDVDVGNILSVSGLTASDGSVVLNADGISYTITPTLNFNGPVSLTYNVIDGNGGSIAASQSYSLAAVNDPTLGAVSISNLTPDLLRTLTVSHNLTDVDGVLSLLGYQWQSSPGGTATWSNIAGATGASYTTDTAGVQLRVVARYTVGGGAVETMISDPVTAAVGAFHIILGTNPAGETLTGTAVADQITGLGGNDTLNGLAGNDVLNGGAGNDTLIGGAGADTMSGGLGNDVYEVTEAGDTVIELTGEGTDLVNSSAASYTLTSNVENLTLTGVAAINGSGNAMNNVILGNAAANTLDGMDGNDTLNGGAGNDTLNGGAGNDTLNGGALGDTLIGGAGSDAINTGAANDDLRDFVRFTAAGDYGDTITNFDANGAAAAQDLVQFSDLLNTLFDDGTNNDDILFFTGNGANGGNTAVNLNTTIEGLYLSGASGEGVIRANLANAAVVAAEFNAEFALTAADGEATLLVINDTDFNSAAVWQWVQNTTAAGQTAEIDVGELTLIGVINANATVATTSFDFV